MGAKKLKRIRYKVYWVERHYRIMYSDNRVKKLMVLNSELVRREYMAQRLVNEFEAFGVEAYYEKQVEWVPNPNCLDDE